MSKPRHTAVWAEWLSKVGGSEDDQMLAGFREWMRKGEGERAKYTKAVMEGWLAGSGRKGETIH